jgi:phage/plasmid-like protein (TIGR03299 family)
MHAVETMTHANATPWHGLGTQLPEDGLRNWRVAAQAAGLDWTVEPRPLYLADPASPFTLGDPVDHVANIRTSDNSVLGVVSRKFRVLQNSEAFAWFDPLLASGEVTIESAGALFNGKRIWALGRIAGAEALVRENDSVRRYVLLSHGHDGSLCVRLGLTDVRVVCHNTLSLAHGSEGSELIRLRHTKNLIDNMDAVRKALDVTRNGFFATLEQYRRLADKAINQADIRRYVHLVFEPKLDLQGEVTSERVAVHVQNVIDLALRGRGNNGSSVWDAYNAVTEFTSWERGRTQDGRINSLWFGESAKLNQKALSVALELATA